MQPAAVAATAPAFPASPATQPIPQAAPQPAVAVAPIQSVQPIQPVQPIQAASPNQTLRIEPGQNVSAQAASPHAQAAPQQAAPQQAAPQQAAFVAPAPQAAAGFAPPPASPAASGPASKAASSQGGNVVVELGTHSVSNFYKGLGGNDVIEHGGIFVATYKIPKIGAQVNLRILLPGDYEFQAAGVVQWIREPHSAGDSSEPGFGARFVQITPEGRQLVYRYTRNRAPMFYDDL